MLDIKYRFTCRDSDLSEIIKKCKNIVARIVWKFYVCCLLFQWWFNFLKKVPILAQKYYFVQKSTNRQSWKFFKVKFWPKPRAENSANTKPLNLELLTELTCFIFKSWLEKCFKIIEKIQKINCEGDWVKLPSYQVCYARYQVSLYLWRFRAKRNY